MDTSNYLQPREYEMLTILLPDQGEEETQSSIDKMLGYITDQNGTIDSVNADSPWGRRRLAYSIRHQGVDYRDGHYVLVYFTAMPSAIAEIERELKLDTSVIRYLLLIHDPEMGEKFDESQIAAEGEQSEEAETTEPAPAEETAGEEAPAEEAPEEAAQAEETSEDTAPEEEAPAEEAVAEETPAEEEAPAEEAGSDETEESDKE